MTWIKVDDQMPDHPKVAGLTDAAFRLHVTGLCYSGRYLTDGAIPSTVVARSGVRNPERAAAELVSFGVWNATETGFEIDGYLDHQRSRAEAEAIAEKRALAGKKGGKASAKAKQVAKQTASNPPSKAQAEVDTEVDTERENTSTPAGVDTVDPEVLSLCNHLADRIEGNGSKRPTIGARWLTAARLMIEVDGRDPVKAHRLIDWCQDDEFERGNVLSMSKFRARYDSLRLKANRSMAAARPRESAAMSKGRRAVEAAQRVSASDALALMVGEAS